MTIPSHILIADNEHNCRNTLATLLSREGYHCVCTADTGMTAATLRGACYDLLVTDTTTAKGLSGELVEELKRSRRLPPTILMITPPLPKAASQSFRLPVVASFIK